MKYLCAVKYQQMRCHRRILTPVAKVYDENNTPNYQKNRYAAGKKIGRLCMKRDCIRRVILQQKNNDEPSSSKSLEKALSVVEKKIHQTKTRHIAVREVYDLLNTVFGESPWPVPSCAILFHLELSPGASLQEREEELRELIRRDRTVRHGSL